MESENAGYLLESLLDDLFGKKYKIVSDGYDDKNQRIIQLRKHTMHLTLVLTNIISYDLYSYLTEGIYEIGDLHLLTNRLLETKKICVAYNAREMNTTERLYPSNRRGKETQTSGL
jgi:hypothetical protein